MASNHQPQQQKTTKKKSYKVIIAQPPPPPTTTSQPQSTVMTSSSSTLLSSSSTTIGATSLSPSTVGITSSASTTTSTLPSSSSTTLPSSSTTTITYVTSSSSFTATLPSSSSAAPPSSSTAVAAAPPTAVVTVEWGECGWAIKAWPRGAIIPSSPGYIFCYIHDDLARVVPKDDIYAQPPSQLLLNRRANLPQDQTYAVHSPRYLNNNKTARRTIANSSACWKSRGTSKTVAGKDGKPAGIMYPLVLKYKMKQEDDRKRIWEADEYVSHDCKDGKSAVVVLRCLDAEWRKTELEVLAAEENIEMSYRRQFSFKDKISADAQVNNWKDAEKNYQQMLDAAISSLRSQRMELLREESILCEFVSSASISSIRFEEEVFPRVTGGIRIQEPSLPPNDLVPVRDESDGDEIRYFDTRISRREAARLRAKEKGKEKMVEGKDKRK